MPPLSFRLTVPYWWEQCSAAERRWCAGKIDLEDFLSLCAQDIDKEKRAPSP